MHKKKIIVCVVIGIFLCVILVFYKKPISIIPKSEKIISISINNNTNEKVLSSREENEILNLMNKSYSRIINRSSVNDSPYVDEFYTITIVKTQKESDILYVYKDEKRYFIEKPYTGVYHASSKLFEFLDKKLSQ